MIIITITVIAKKTLIFTILEIATPTVNHQFGFLLSLSS